MSATGEANANRHGLLTAEQITALAAAPLGDGKNKCALARNLSRKTQEQVAEDLGFTQSYVSKVERGAIGVLVDQGHVFAAYYGAPLDVLFPASTAATAAATGEAVTA